jgi:hypothetical protein
MTFEISRHFYHCAVAIVVSGERFSVCYTYFGTGYTNLWI